ncbi:MAG: tRNA lysidine(34) synthetase TilS [Candidatus Omnitrophota bacterium]
MSLLRRVKETIKRYGLLSKSDKVVVGVSGGPDSVTLILVLNSLRKELKLNLHIAHLDHQIREDSYRDSEFVESLAQRLDLPFISEAIDIRNLAKKGSIEENARKQRLKFLFDAAGKVNASKIALGHNRDDQAETVLMRLIRGTGLYGLASMLPRRKIAGFMIIRPLIEVSRSDIESYLKRRKIRPRTDPTNRDIAYFRNRIRRRLIPELAKNYNSNIKEVLANLARTAACDYDYLEKAARKALNGLKKPLAIKGDEIKSGMRLDLNRLSKLHPAIERLVLRLSISQVTGTTRRLSFKHIEELEDLIFCRPINSVVDLPRGVSVRKDKRHLFIYQKRT